MPFRVSPWLKPSKKKVLWGACLSALLVSVEAAYYAAVYRGSSILPPETGLVLVYSGGDDRTGIARHWPEGREKPLYLFSGWDYSHGLLEKRLHLGDRMLVEDKARTTDQNARYCAPVLKKAGVHSIVLALPWYHLPRALFLTRFYLLGAGVTVQPFATSPLPPHWWLNRNFYVELAKFWGSLGRIALSWVGVENWPRPTGGP